MEAVWNDAEFKQNLFFLLLGVMLGLVLSIAKRSLCGEGKSEKARLDGENESDWEDESEEEGTSNANAE